MPATLVEIVHHKRLWLARQDGGETQKMLPATGRFLSMLTQPGCQLIAEIKPKSPSGGVLDASFEPATLIEAYQPFADGVSVLTDEAFFGGSFQLLSTVSLAMPQPALCKDFVLDVRQVHWARQYGAEAVLLIVKILVDDELLALHQAVLEAGMTPVVEVQNEAEVERALKLSPQALLINNRNLDDYTIDLNTTIRLAPLIPEPVKLISASGLLTVEDIKTVRPFVHAVLIGSSLMSAPDRHHKLAAFKTALEG